MEKEKYQKMNAASFTWWQDSHNRLPQSPWLQATLSDLDDKTKLMLSIIDQDDGDTFVRRAEMYYNRRPELLQTIHELHKSYCSMSQRYRHLTAQYPMLHSLQYSIKHQDCENSHPVSLSVACLALEPPANKLTHDHHVSPTPTSKSQESQGEADAEKKLEGTQSDHNNNNNNNVSYEFKLRLLKLLVDSLHKQGELTRTNNEIREAIQHFRASVKALVDDNTSFNTFDSKP